MLARFKHCIANGLEDESVDLKSHLDLSDKAALVKDITAMAHTGRECYILYGVADENQRRNGAEAVPGIDVRESADALERRIREVLAKYVSPLPDFRFFIRQHKETGRNIGILVIKASANPGYNIVVNVPDSKGDIKLRPGEFWIRRGTQNLPMSIHEIRSLPSKPHLRPITVINFGHPLTPENRIQLEGRGFFVEHEFGDRVQLDDQADFGPQIRSIIDELEFTSSEWQGWVAENVLFVLPGLAEAAAVVLAELHGRMGHFPRIIRRARGTGTSGFSVVEIVDLQDVRNMARAQG